MDASYFGSLGPLGFRAVEQENVHVPESRLIIELLRQPEDHHNVGILT